MEVLFLLVILLFSAILHEVAHGFVADRLGDPTARIQGRLTLNPVSHIDPLMSIFLPLMLLFSGSPIVFGAAKPVPVDPFNLAEGRRDVALVALAGPLTNVLLAIAAAIFFRIVSFGLPLDSSVSFVLSEGLRKIMEINILLAIFNLLPIPPLDGSKVFATLLPEKDANSYLSLGQLGMIILFFLLVFPIGGFSLTSFIYNILTFLERLLLP